MRGRCSTCTTKCSYLRGYVAELEEYRQKYIDLLNSSTAHNEHMIGGLLQIAMKPGVLNALKGG